MRLSNDLRKFLELLNSRGVEYVIVGAHSLAFHGRPRYTGDLGILIRATPKNAAKIVDLLNEFGFAHSGFRESDSANQVIQLGRAPNRVDLLSSISGVSTDEAFAAESPQSWMASLFSSWARRIDPKQARTWQAAGFSRLVYLGKLTGSRGNYFFSPDVRPNQRRFFGFGSSAGAGVSAVFSSSVVGSSSLGSSSLASVSLGFGSAAFFFVFFSSAGFSSTSAISTHSMNAILAESLLRWPSFTMRVYPPFRSADLGAMSSNNFLTTFFCRNAARAVRRA